MTRWIKRIVVLALVGVVTRWVLNSKTRANRFRSGVAPTIGGDTWPPVPVNPARDI